MMSQASRPQAPSALLIKGGTLWSDGIGFVQSGNVLIRDGKIEAVGSRVAAPDNARIVDATRGYILPGFVEAHSQIGLRGDSIAWDTDEDVRPITPEMRAIDAYYPFGRDVEDARAAGVTTALVVPAGKNVLGGTGAIVKLAGSTLDDVIVKDPAALKLSLGEEAKRDNAAPRTRMGEVALLRENLEKARDYATKRRRDGADPDPKLEPIAALLRGDFPAIVQAYRAGDIANALRLAAEFKFKLIIAYGYEGPLVAADLQRAGVAVVATPIKGLWYRLEKETFDSGYPAALLKAGVRVAIQQGEGNPFGGRELLLNAGYLMKYGVSEEDALRAITSWPAQILGIDARIGRLAPGADADVLVLSGRPFDIRTRVLDVFINGREVAVNR